MILFYAKHNKIFSMWKTFDMSSYIVRFFIRGGMVDWQIKNDENFIENLAKKVETPDEKIDYSDVIAFDILKKILDMKEGSQKELHENYLNSKVMVNINGDKNVITLRLKQKAYTKSFNMDDTFYPQKLVTFVQQLK